MSASPAVSPSNQPEGIPWRALLIALALGFVLRIVVFNALRYSFDTGDPITYQAIGRNLAAHGAYSHEYSPPFVPTVLRPPVLPALFALTLRLFGDGYLALQLTQAVLSLGAILLLYLAVRQFSTALAATVFVLGLLSPFDAAFAGALLTESLCGSLLVAAFTVPLLLRSRVGWLLSGALLAAAVLTKDVYMGLLIIVPVLLLLGRAPDTNIHRRHAALLFLAAAMLVISPWTWRNYRVRHQFIPVTAGLTGQGLFFGTYMRYFTNADDPRFEQLAYGDFDDRAQSDAAFDIVDERARDLAFIRLTWQRIRTKPWIVLGNCLVRPWQLWLTNRLPFELRFAPAGSPMWRITKYGLGVLNVLIVAFGAAGLWMALRCRYQLLWLAVPIGYTALAYVPFQPEARHSQPIFLLLLVFAALAVCRLFGLHVTIESRSVEVAQ